MNEGEPVKSYSPWNGGGITAIHKWAVKSSIAQGGWRVVGEPCKRKSKPALDPDVASRIRQMCFQRCRASGRN